MIDLVPQEYYDQQKIKLGKIGFIIVSLLVIVLVTFGALNFFRLIIRNNILTEKIQLTEEQLQQVKGETVSVLKLRADLEDLRVKAENKKSVMGDRINWSLPLQNIRDILPQTAWLNKYQINGSNKFQLSGYALEQDDLAAIIDGLKGSKYFNNIYVEMTNKTNFSKDGYPQQTVFSYQLSGRVVAKGGT